MEKRPDTAQGHRRAWPQCRKVSPWTGTLIGGYAEHRRPLLFRLGWILVQEGLAGRCHRVSRALRRIERESTNVSCVGEDNRMCRGSKSTTKSCGPAHSVLFGRQLIEVRVLI